MSTQLTIIAICQLIATIAMVAAAAGLLYVAFSLKRLIATKIDEAMAEVRPIAEQARAIAEQAAKTADMVSEKVDAIMTTAEDGATSVGNTVQSVSKRMEEAVNPQMVNIAAWVGAAAKCVQIWRDVSTMCCAPKKNEEPAKAEE